MTDRAPTPREPSCSRPLPAELCRIGLFSHLDSGQLEWLATVGELLDVDAGTVLFDEGQPAEWLVVLLTGEIMMSHVVAGREEVLTRHTSAGADGTADDAGSWDKPPAAHGFTGEIPLLAGGDYIATATAVAPSRVVRYTRAEFEEMMVHCPQVCRVLLPVLAWRVHASAARASQRERLDALATLASGLAHELNNPAAAVVRSAEALGLALDDMQIAVSRWTREAGPAEAELLDAALGDLLSRSTGSAARDPLAVVDAEAAVEEWLADRGVENDVLVDVLVERGIGTAWLASLGRRLTPAAFPAAAATLAASVAARGLADDIAEAGRRISGIVAASREYSNLDRSPQQSFDIEPGLAATVRVLAPVLARVRVHLDCAPGLPRVSGHPGELNQVWTNLIKNAAEAMGGDGDLWLRVGVEGTCVVAEIVDSGPGIPADLLPRIFDPFFTTHDIGKGTGLGLHLSHLIVTRLHQGSMEVESRPGRTRFVVRLPAEGRDDRC